MRKVLGLLLLVVMFNLASCAKCNICEIDGVETAVCTNSVLDRAKAKSNCKKDGGEWIKVEKQ